MGVFEPLPAPAFILPNIDGFDAAPALLVPAVPKSDGDAVPLAELPMFPNRLPVLALEPPWLAPNGELEPKRPPAVAPLEEGVLNENVLLLDMVTDWKGPREEALLCENTDELGESWTESDTSELTTIKNQEVHNRNSLETGTREVEESRCGSKYSAY